MLDPEEKKTEPEQNPSSVAENSIPASENLSLSESREEVVLEAAQAATLPQRNPLQSAPLPKVELKKHATAVALPHTATPPASGAPASLTTEPVLTSLKKEDNTNLPRLSIEVEIDFVLDRKCIPLSALSTLAVGEMITLSGADFKATLFLQEKAIGEGELVLVDEKPTIQITKIFNVS
ncbi:MAG: hypothetical protein FJ390_00110 [Verrucomicrobia bacterium]|nr:hypothetical protein [Verrucomicrobiota bacterium]